MRVQNVVRKAERLLGVMSVPLADQNEALVAAGFGARFPALPSVDLSPEIEAALAQMLAQHEPFPLVVLSPDGTVLRTNNGARRLFGAFLLHPELMPEPADLFTLLFDPRLLRPHIVEWQAFARRVVSRLHREHLQSGDARLGAVIERILELDVPEDFRYPSFETDLVPAHRLELARGGLRARFLVTLTTFLAPRDVTLEELRIESCFPVDEATRALCRTLAAG